MLGQVACSGDGETAANAATVVTELIVWARRQAEPGVERRILAQSLLKGRIWNLMCYPPTFGYLSCRLGALEQLLEWHSELRVSEPDSELSKDVWVGCAALSPELAAHVQRDLLDATAANAMALLLLLRCAVVARCEEIDTMLCCAGLGGLVIEFAAKSTNQCLLRNAAADVIAALLNHEAPLVVKMMAPLRLGLRVRGCR